MHDGGDGGDFAPIDDLTADHECPTDPGAEVVDLPTSTDHGIRYGVRRGLELDQGGDPAWTAAMRSARPTPELTGGALSALVGWTEYEWATWLPDVLRRARLHVVEHPGWRTRGRPRSVGPWQPRGVMWHHDASGRGPSPYVARFLADVGRPAEGIPAPLSQAWVCMGCDGRHPVGTWHVLAAGRANHAGNGGGWGKLRADVGNTATIGVETDNTSGEDTPHAMYRSLVVGSAAILRRLRSHPRDWLVAHREYARGRKIDPDDVDMHRARRATSDVMAGMAGRVPAQSGSWAPAVRKPDGDDGGRELLPYPGRDHFAVSSRCPHGWVGLLRRWLIAAGFDDYPEGAREFDPGPVFTHATRRNVAAFQRSRPELRGDADGYPGPLTWRLLQQRAAARVRA